MMNLHKISKDDKIMMLAYDQGFEHGPIDFNMTNADPNYIFDIALHGDFTAVATQIGVAEKYWKGDYQDVPLVVKLNGKTRFNNHDPLSLQHTSVRRAQELGASAVGYTLYLGSTHEQKMFKEFGEICQKAHRMGLSVVAWTYPRGPHIEDEASTDTIAYAARVAMELGADVVKIKYNGDKHGLRWIKRCVGQSKIVVAGGSKKSASEYIQSVYDTKQNGSSGVAVGRNIWKSDSPLKVSAATKKVLFDGQAPHDVAHLIE